MHIRVGTYTENIKGNELLIPRKKSNWFDQGKQLVKFPRGANSYKSVPIYAPRGLLDLSSPYLSPGEIRKAQHSNRTDGSQRKAKSSRQCYKDERLCVFKWRRKYRTNFVKSKKYRDRVGSWINILLLLIPENLWFCEIEVKLQYFWIRNQDCSR